MALVSMDITPEGVVPDGYDPCPRVYLTAEQVAALGITKPPRAGEMLSIKGIVEVSDSREYEGDKDKIGISLALDIEYLEIGPPPRGKSAELYSDKE